MKTLLSTAILLSSAVAFADEPAPPAPAPAPEPAPAPAEPAPPPPPEEPAKNVTITPAPTGAMDTKPTPGAVLSSTVDGGGVSASSGESAPKKSKIALEISGAGAGIANQFIEYKGWKFENGPSKGLRLEANLIGIQLAYELSSMSNTQACASDCYKASGSTSIHSFELGYRFRFSQLGPVRPFVTASIGGVLANGGDYTMDKSAKGGSGRAGFGIEIPIMDKFFASATLAYRIVVVENPLRNVDQEKADKILLGTDVPNGDYAEDLHMISGYVGFGVQL